MTAMIVAALVLVLQLAVTLALGAVAAAWWLSPSSPAGIVARWWRRRIVAVMLPVPGRAVLAGGAW